MHVILNFLKWIRDFQRILYKNRTVHTSEEHRSLSHMWLILSASLHFNRISYRCTSASTYRFFPRGSDSPRYHAAGVQKGLLAKETHAWGGVRNLCGRVAGRERIERERPRAIIKTDIDFAIARPGPHDSRTSYQPSLISTGHNCTRDSLIPVRFSFSLSLSPEYSLVATEEWWGGSRGLRSGTHTHTHTCTRHRSIREKGGMTPSEVRAKIYRPLTDTEPCSKCCKTHRRSVGARVCTYTYKFYIYIHVCIYRERERESQAG